MFDHVTIRVSDRAASERFYETVLAAIEIDKGNSSDWLAEWDDFSLSPATSEHPATTGLHIAFSAWSNEDVERFWHAGVDAGYRSDGEPGLRPQYRADYYGAFLLDPDGNSVEAVHHGGLTRDGNIDHMWIRVEDLAAVRGFYEAISPHSGYPLLWDHPGRVHFGAMGSHFALVQDSPVTANLHLAFGSDSNETVDAFHAAATAAGYEDNGGPGERERYHPGYYGAFVLDPAGTNVEVVNHNRG
jgi:catechol 2,3-dioxygenase-like lactoylglutathione lyase family enzyme